MKKFLLLSLFIGTAFAQETSYKVSYQDQGAVISHATCNLNIYSKGFDSKYLSSDMQSFLATKGYRPIERRWDLAAFSDLNGQPIEGDLALEMNTFHDGKNVHNEGALGYIVKDSSNQYYSEIIPDFKAFKSEVFKMRESRGTPLFTFGQQQVQRRGYPFTTTTKKGRKSLLEVYDSLPDCVTLDSGHHYEMERYNGNIVLSEMNACLSLYKREKRRIQIYKNSSWPLISGYATYATLLTGSFFTNPILLTAGGGLLSYKLIKGLRNSSLEKNLSDSERFISNIKSCYIKNLEGQKCGNAKSYSVDSLSIGLKDKTRGRIGNYLESMSSEELTVKVADYIASERPCSMTVKKVRKTVVHKILNNVEKTL